MHEFAEFFYFETTDPKAESIIAWFIWLIYEQSYLARKINIK